jgi:hypothetical protein
MNNLQLLFKTEFTTKTKRLFICLLFVGFSLSLQYPADNGASAPTQTVCIIRHKAVRESQ